MDTERRDFLVGAAGLMAAIAAGGCAAASGPSASAATRRTPMFAYVGCYTSKERNGKGEGVSVYRMDAASGEWTQVQVVKDVVNPSWLTLDHRRRFLYAAHGDGSEATAFAIDTPSGRLTLLNRQPTNGRNGVRLAIDASNRFAVLANYSTGTVAVLPINPDGSLAPLTDLVTLQGKPGPHRTEQASAHPHDVVFEPRGRFVVVPDKGLDATFVYRQQRHVRDRRGAIRRVRLRQQPWPRQHRHLRRRRRHRRAVVGGLGIDAGQGAALLRPR